jgi:hypothetical protein
LAEIVGLSTWISGLPSGRACKTRRLVVILTSAPEASSKSELIYSGLDRMLTLVCLPALRLIPDQGAGSGGRRFKIGDVGAVERLPSD